MADNRLDETKAEESDGSFFHRERENSNINLYQDIKKRINKKYPKTKKFKKIKIIDEFNLIKKIYKDNVLNAKEKIENNNNFPFSCVIETKKYCIIKFVVLNNDGLFIFYNGEKDIEEICGKNVKKLECGQYDVAANGMRGFNYTKIEIQENNILSLADNMENDVSDDIEYFMNNKSIYDKHKLTYKRGILLYGSPGNGKTTLIRSLMKKYKNIYSFIIDPETTVGVNLINSLTYVASDSMKILILEDIDRYNDFAKSALLNTLDGAIKIDNFYIIATCNDLTKVDKALLNRPSRFDKIYVIEDPNTKQREELLSFYFKNLSADKLKECVNLSKGFNCAYFKEIFICSKIHKSSPVEAVKYIQKRLEQFNIKKDAMYTG